MNEEDNIFDYLVNKLAEKRRRQAPGRLVSDWALQAEEPGQCMGSPCMTLRMSAILLEGLM